MRKHFRTKRVIQIWLLAAILTLTVFTFLKTFFPQKVAFDCKDDKQGVDSLLHLTATSSCLEDASRYIDMAKSMAMGSSCPELPATVMLAEGKLFVSVDNYKEALKAFHQSARLFGKSRHYEGLADAYYNLADVYKIIGNYNKCIEFCLLGLEACQNIDNKLLQRRFYRTLGSAYKYLGDYEKSLLHYGIALQMSIEEGDAFNISSSLNNLGTTYETMGNDSLALLYFFQSMEKLGDKANPGSLAIYYNNIGGIYLRQKSYEEAIKNLKLALEYRKAVKDRRRESTLLINIGNYFLETQQIDSSLFYYQKAHDIAFTDGYHENLMKARMQLSRAFRNKGDFNQAYSWLLKYMETREDYLSFQMKSELSNMDANFQDLKSQLELNNTNVRQRLMRVIYTLLVFLLFLILLGLVLYYYQSFIKQKQSNKKIAIENTNLEKVIIDRNKELVTYSMQLAQRQESLNQVIKKFRDNLHLIKEKAVVEQVINELKNESLNASMWKDFDIRFNEVHQDFYKNLSEAHPGLSLNEKRLCAFLLLNLSTKEISAITSQSPHSINVARTRLRKKLGMAHSNQQLYDFLADYR